MFTKFQLCPAQNLCKDSRKSLKTSAPHALKGGLSTDTTRYDFQPEPSRWTVLMSVCGTRCMHSSNPSLFTPYKKCNVADTDPYWYGCSGSGSVLGMLIRIQEHGNWLKEKNKPGFLPFKKASIFDLLSSLTQIRNRIRLAPSIRIWIRMEIKKLDPDPQWNQCGSTTLEKKKGRCYAGMSASCQKYCIEGFLTTWRCRFLM